MNIPYFAVSVAFLNVVGVVNAAHAQSIRPYVEGNLGVMVAKDIEYNSPALDRAVGGSIDAEVEVEEAFSFGGEIGAYLDPVLPGLRASISGAYRSSEFGDSTVSVNGTRGTPSDSDGDVSFTTFHVNVYYDFDIGMPVAPFLGVGAGASVVDVESPVDTIPRFDDSDTSFSWSLMAGLNYALTDHIIVGGKYRFTHVPEFKLDGRIDPNTIGIAGAPFDSNYETDGAMLHEFLVTAAYRF